MLRACRQTVCEAETSVHDSNQGNRGKPSEPFISIACVNDDPFDRLVISNQEWFYSSPLPEMWALLFVAGRAQELTTHSTCVTTLVVSEPIGSWERSRHGSASAGLLPQVK